ncbi:hypothetical protein PPTG_22555 [Phytophthora nicotianae INRA-310]|uniref:Uncharacterized protein n=1 Tax=Phytophthora nicotianae (strain INRA-310) TaxID=761204 RepID=W2QGB2_PHYN3|nr:hypothetical protein PPTG_22555 [Phytophthora nicotianae INRA-310]ETN11911.1 hypothetical protein PPTG_22555 [Phytophthora nicotianae INRA-310]
MRLAYVGEQVIQCGSAEAAERTVRRHSTGFARGGGGAEGGRRVTAGLALLGGSRLLGGSTCRGGSGGHLRPCRRHGAATVDARSSVTSGVLPSQEPVALLV